MEIKTAEITGIAFGGKGVARVDGKVFFVEDAVPGDVVSFEVGKDSARYGDGRVSEWHTRSSLRSEKTPCRFSAQCGGCQWMDISYSQQLEWKKNFVSSALQRVGKLPADVDVKIVPADNILGYRNRILVRMHWKAAEGPRLGYFRKGTRELVSIDRCAIAAGGINDFFAEFFKATEKTNSAIGFAPQTEMRCRMEIQEVFAEGAKKVIVTVYPAEKPFERYGEFVARILRGLKSVAWAGLIFEVENAPLMVFDKDDIDYLTRPGQFQQVNLDANRLLRAWVKEKVAKLRPKRMLDLFCGSGNLSLQLSQLGVPYVEGLEVNKRAIEVANSVVSKLGLVGTNYHAGDSDALLMKYAKTGVKFDLILVDPPREGMYDALIPLKTIAPTHLIYVSCDPVTLARDLGSLCRSGMEIVELVSFDFFPNTFHVETAVLLRQIPAKSEVK